MASFKNMQQAGANVVGSLSRSAAPQSQAPATAAARVFDGRTQLREACKIRLDRIVPDPNQPRKEFDEASLGELADSLKTRGQLQPIRVRWDEAAEVYVVVVGERRLRAAQQAGLDSVVCVVAPGNATPEELLEDQLVENALRQDLKPVEEARAYRQLLDRLGISQRQLAERLHVSPQKVTRALALLDLPADVQESVEQGAIAPQTAYEISRIEDSAEQQELIEKARRGELKREVVRERATKAPRKARTEGGRVEFRTSRGTVLVSGSDDVIATLEEALAQARAASADSARGQAA
jgi:ParB family chromosome partitioning protein